jgi:hypothetical protein
VFQQQREGLVLAGERPGVFQPGSQGAIFIRWGDVGVNIAHHFVALVAVQVRVGVKVWLGVDALQVIQVIGISPDPIASGLNVKLDAGWFDALFVSFYFVLGHVFYPLLRQ